MKILLELPTNNQPDNNENKMVIIINPVIIINKVMILL